MKRYQCPILLCIVYISVHCVYATNHGSDGGTLLDALRTERELQNESSNPARNGIGLQSDEELFNVAFKFIEQLEQTRKSLSGLRDVLDYIDGDLQERAHLLEDRYVKGKGLWKILKQALNGADATEDHQGHPAGARKAKRMCRVNLGGHCQTENAASLANQMHFLSSGLSPGKRRRRAALSAGSSNLSPASRSAAVSANDMDMDSFRKLKNSMENGI